MRIYLSSGHRYPGRLYAVAANAVHDDLAQGLAELGHEVRYQVQVDGDERLPDGVVPVSGLHGGEEIVHHLGLAGLPETSLPWVRTSHSHATLQGLTLDVLKPQDIAVSRTLAKLHGSERFVYNGIIPDNFIYSEAKSNYFLFVVGGIKRATAKGLEIAFRISELTGIELRVAATGDNPQEIEAFGHRCRGRGAVFLGPIRGRRKAEAFAAAKAVLFPSQLNEAFGMVIPEAWTSGTPVIASSNGAIPEILDPAGGFVCRTEAEYLQAVADIDRVAPRVCREMAMNRFHYLAMARAYVEEYQRELSGC